MGDLKEKWKKVRTQEIESIKIETGQWQETGLKRCWKIPNWGVYALTFSLPVVFQLSLCAILVVDHMLDIFEMMRGHLLQVVKSQLENIWEMSIFWQDVRYQRPNMPWLF